MPRSRPGRSGACRYPRTRSSTSCAQQGEDDKASKADSELPDQVDTEKHSGTLDKLGIDPGMIGKLGAAGGIGDKLGL